MRNSSIELLRILAMLFIVTDHVLCHGLHDEWIGTDYLRPFVACGVNLFILISGYFGIRFRLKGFINLLLMVSFYNLVSCLIATFALGEPVGLKSLVGIVLPLSSNRFYWFITCYLILYLLSPILNAGIEKLHANNTLKYYPPLLLYLTCFGGWAIGNFLINKTGFHIMQFITLYFVGRYVSLYDIPAKVSKKALLLTILTAYPIMLLLAGVLNPYRTVTANNSPFNILMSVTLLLLFVKTRLQSGWINKIAKTMLAEYLLQDGMAGVLIYTNVYQWYRAGAVGHILVYVLLLFVCAYLLEMVRTRLFRLLPDKIGNPPAAPTT